MSPAQFEAEGPPRKTLWVVASLALTLLVCVPTYGEVGLRRVLLPVLVAGAPLLAWNDRVARHARATVAALLLSFAVIGSASVGWFLLPAVIAMLVAWDRHGPEGPGRGSHTTGAPDA